MTGESSRINQSKSQKPRKNFVPQIQKKEKTSFQGVVKYLLLTAFDLAEYHGMPFSPPRGPRHRNVHGAVRQEPRNELARTVSAVP